jgi:ankyrin repeat protein
MKLKTVVLTLSCLLVIHIGYKFVSQSNKTSVAQQKDIAKLNSDLNWAVLRGDSDKASALIEQGADVNFSVPNDGKTPLHIAVTYGDEAKLNLKDVSILPDKAIMDKRLKVVKLLIERGANVKATTTQGVTPLHKAATKEIAELLIQHGAIVDAQDFSEERLTPLFIATGKHKSVAETLINHGADVNQKTTSGDTPLLLAARNNNLEVVKLLIKRGADVNYQDKDARTALEFAFQGQNHAIAQLLMDKGAAVTSQSGLGLNELHWAVKQNDIEMVTKILGKGGSVDPISKDGRTPLMEAVFNNNKPIAELLIKHGANVNFSSANNWNNRPILFFIKDKEMMALMLSHGANTKVLDGDGKNVFYYLHGKEDLIGMVKNASN